MHILSKLFLIYQIYSVLKMNLLIAYILKIVPNLQKF